jgi:hypothetical protein
MRCVINYFLFILLTHHRNISFYSFAHFISLEAISTPTDIGGWFFYFASFYCRNLDKSSRIIMSFAIAGRHSLYFYSPATYAPINC